MAREEWSGQPDESSGGSVGLVLALILGGIVLVLLLACGGGFAFVRMAGEAQVEARVAEEEAVAAARDAHREVDKAMLRISKPAVRSTRDSAGRAVPASNGSLPCPTGVSHRTIARVRVWAR
jgi:hypothetical protein